MGIGSVKVNKVTVTRTIKKSNIGSDKSDLGSMQSVPVTSLLLLSSDTGFHNQVQQSLKQRFTKQMLGT